MTLSPATFTYNWW